jgi:hypothetical protein
LRSSCRNDQIDAAKRPSNTASRSARSVAPRGGARRRLVPFRLLGAGHERDTGASWLTPVAKYGFLGVPAFFVISGFVAVGLLINQFYRGRRDPMLYGLMQAPVTS